MSSAPTRLLRFKLKVCNCLERRKYVGRVRWYDEGGLRQAISKASSDVWVTVGRGGEFGTWRGIYTASQSGSATSLMVLGVFHF